MKTRTILLITLLLLSTLAVYATSSPKPIASGQVCTTFPDCWNYRKKITIKNNVDKDLTDYQINITVHYGSGTDTNYDIYLNSHSQTDFDDIRFALPNGTLLSYWNETLYPGDNATFWVKVPNIPALGTTDIYIYYGNPDAGYAGSGDDTFLFFDDFSEDLSKWTIISGTWEIINGELRCTVDSDYSYIRANYFITDAAIHVKIRVGTAGYYDNGGIIARYMDTKNYYAAIFYPDYSGHQHRLIKYTAGDFAELAHTSAPDDTNWHKLVFVLYGTSLGSWLDGNYEISATDNDHSSGYVGLRAFDTNHHFYFDDFFVRKYVSPEPTISAVGSEENRKDVTITLTPYNIALSSNDYFIAKYANDTGISIQHLTNGTNTLNIWSDFVNITLISYLSNSTARYLLDAPTNGTADFEGTIYPYTSLD
ncbi:MAG: hypothetical protein DRI48_08245, partial [Chloroflexi bacterium]